MRKQMASLSIVVEEVMMLSPFSSALFVFTNKNRKTIKAIYWDKSGFALWSKKLEKEKFYWPTFLQGDISIKLSPQELSLLLDGINLAKLRGHKELKYQKTC
jgi:transposase